MAKKSSKNSSSKNSKALDKEIKKLEGNVKDSQTKAEQDSAIEKLNAKNAEAGKPTKSLSELKTKAIDASTQFEGTETKGNNLGKAREVNSASIAPVERVTARDIGQVSKASSIALAPVTNADSARIDTVKDNQFRERQLALVQALEDRASGRAPSIADMQLRVSADRLLKNQAASMASARGVNPGLAARIIANRSGDLQTQIAQQSAIQRVQEQQAAQAQLSDVISQGRGIDIQTAINQAQLEENTSLANAQAANRAAEVQAGLAQQTELSNTDATNRRQTEQAELGTRADLSNQLAENNRALNQAQLEQQASLSNQAAVNQQKISQGSINSGIAQAGIGASATVAAANAAANATKYASDNSLLGNTLNIAANVNQNQASNSGAGQNANANATSNYNSTTGSVVGSVINAGGAAAIRSDETKKKNIKSADRDIKSFLDALEAEKYKYKDKDDGKGEYVGVMAQDLEDSSVGKTMVADTPKGKMVNFVRGLGAILAAQAHLNKRLSKLEARA